jgi:hypothetical protein
MCHLAAISLRTGKSLKWDPDREEFTGWHAKLANSYVSREMRKPYDYSYICGLRLADNKHLSNWRWGSRLEVWLPIPK